MISFKNKGDFSKTLSFFTGMKKGINKDILDKYGKEGVNALKSATPVESGKTAASWYYEIMYKNGSVVIVWKNSNIQNGVPIAVIIQYGHATKNGGWVQGRDYINPALRPIFDKIADEAWKGVTGQ